MGWFDELNFSVKEHRVMSLEKKQIFPVLNLDISTPAAPRPVPHPAFESVKMLRSCIKLGMLGLDC